MLTPGRRHDGKRGGTPAPDGNTADADAYAKGYL